MLSKRASVHPTKPIASAILVLCSRRLKWGLLGRRSVLTLPSKISQRPCPQTRRQRMVAGIEERMRRPRSKSLSRRPFLESDVQAVVDASQYLSHAPDDSTGC